jgi:hypothetical protein
MRVSTARPAATPSGPWNQAIAAVTRAREGTKSRRVAARRSAAAPRLDTTGGQSSAPAGERATLPALYSLASGASLDS